MDYVLFVKPKKDIMVNLNPEEVSDAKYVSIEKLREIMCDGGGDSDDEKMLWSPWFRIIMEKRGFEWWENLDDALTEKGRFIEEEEILYFDPPQEHYAEFNKK